jgi:hypothetical protein
MKNRLKRPAAGMVRTIGLKLVGWAVKLELAASTAATPAKGRRSNAGTPANHTRRKSPDTLAKTLINFEE